MSFRGWCTSPSQSESLHCFHTVSTVSGTKGYFPCSLCTILELQIHKNRSDSTIRLVIRQPASGLVDLGTYQSRFSNPTVQGWIDGIWGAKGGSTLPSVKINLICEGLCKAGAKSTRIFFELASLERTVFVPSDSHLCWLLQQRIRMPK